MHRLSLLITFLAIALCAMADSDPYPAFSWTLVDGTGEPVTTKDQSYQGSAPIQATMTVKAVYKDAQGEIHECENAEFIGAWRVWKKDHGQMENPDLSRAETTTDLYFRSFGTDSIAYVGRLTVGNYVLNIDPTYIRNNRDNYFTITTYESKLSFPNAFSPNGDQYNEVFKAKEYQSIVEFHAAIYNRWGQKLFEWSNPRDGWDGTYRGKPVKDGVYYVQVKAKGSDGQVFSIKKDVNLMRGFNEVSTSSTTE